MNIFSGLKTETLKKMKARLASELKDKNLPEHRKNEVLSYLYYIGENKKLGGEKNG